MRGHNYQIVVVNDGSIVQTASVLDEFKCRMPLHIISHPINRGLGKTKRDGFEYSAWKCELGDVMVRVEADDTHEPAYIFSLIEKLVACYDVGNTPRFEPGANWVPTITGLPSAGSQTSSGNLCLGFVPQSDLISPLDAFALGCLVVASRCQAHRNSSVMLRYL